MGQSSSDEEVEELEERIQDLEQTVQEMAANKGSGRSRRSVLAGGAVAGAALLGASSSGSADGLNDGDTQWGGDSNRDDYVIDHADANSVSTGSVVSDVEPEIASTETGLSTPRVQNRDLSQLSYSRPSKPVFAWVLDDGLASHYQTRSVWADKDVQPTIAVQTDLQGSSDHMEWDEIDELADPNGSYGWEVASHGRTNPDLDSADDATILSEIRGAMMDLRAKASEYQNPGLIPNHYVYPKGETGGDFGKGLVSASGYLSGIDASGGTLSANRSLLEVPRESADTTNATTADLETVVDNAISDGVGCIFLSHAVVDGTESDTSGLETSTQKIRDIIDYVRNQGGVWGTTTDVLSEQGGAFHLGGSDAELYSTFAGRIKAVIGGEERITIDEVNTKMESPLYMKDNPLQGVREVSDFGPGDFEFRESYLIDPANGKIGWKDSHGNVYEVSGTQIN